MEEESLFRKDSVDRISSPEQLNDYLRVTSPAVWAIMAAIIVLLVGTIIWSSAATIDSYASGMAQVENGNMIVMFDDVQLARSVQAGMSVAVGETESVISSVGFTENGAVFASASTSLADGTYPARVIYKQTQVLRLLFN